MLSEKTRRKLAGIETCSQLGKHKVRDLFKIALESPDLWEHAYAKIASNSGAMTAGVDGNPLDGHSEDRVHNLIQILKDNRYLPIPSKRVYISKANGKMRPLGISSTQDKLVQEVWKVLLERVYEGIFHRNSHGFRPNRSCHTALQSIQETWNGTKWFIEFDIRGFFDKISHPKLVEILEKRIEDRKFIAVLKKMLKAGYLDNWSFHKTYSGTAQGSGVSPVLANIYLHELDEYIKELQAEYTRGKYRKEALEYGRIRSTKGLLSKKIAQIREQDDPRLATQLIEQWKELGKLQRSIPSKDPLDPNYRRLRYCRYADDFALGLISSKQEAQELQHHISSFLQRELSLEISPEKSGIKHASKGIEFLSYQIVVRSGERIRKVVWHGRPTKRRTKRENIDLLIPVHKLKEFTRKRKYGQWDNHQPIHRFSLLNNSDAEIVFQYNAEMRGLANYYALAKHAKSSLHKLWNLWYRSLEKTGNSDALSEVC